MGNRIGCAAAVAALLALAGCAAEPLPAPSPSATASPFASDEEAFAAAEATYRAYVDALNQVDLQDPATFDAVYAWTTGEANAGARESFTRMHADDLIVTGDSEITEMHRLEATEDRVSLAACLRVADVLLVDRDGASVVSSERPVEQSLRITFTKSHASQNGVLVEEIANVELSDPCAA